MTDRFREAKDKADESFQKAMDDITAAHVAAKEAAKADPKNPALQAAKRASAAELQAARLVERENRPSHHQVGGDFGGTVGQNFTQEEMDRRQSDAMCFMPDDQGGNTNRALQLLVDLFAARGDTVSDPVVVLADMRAGIS